MTNISPIMNARGTAAPVVPDSCEMTPETLPGAVAPTNKA